MNRVRSLWVLTAASVLTAVPVAAQQQAAPVLASGQPVTGEPPRVGAPPAGEPVRADRHVAASDLGFEPGIGPAPGQAVTWQGERYLVVEVVAKDGRPTFAGGSRFVIAAGGGALGIGLKALAPGHDPQVAAAK